MAKRKRSKAEFQLPEAIIQHIQSFLNGKEAAQTTILSKSWYTAWLTRPNLDFVQKHFVPRKYDAPCSPAIRLWDFVNKTVDRYDKLNLKIDSLRLWNDWPYMKYTSAPVNNQSILKALKMGATNIDLDLSVDREFALPQQVFESENLMRLSLHRTGKISIGADGKVSCWRLKSLALRAVYVEDDTIREIMSSCPLIEDLELCSIYNCVSLSPFTKCGKLKCLSLSSINLHTLFFNDFSSKFPCLKDLSVDNCLGKISIGADGKVSWSRFKSLTLTAVYVEEDTIREIMSSCSLIENMDLFPDNRVSLSPLITKFGKLKCLSLCGIDLHTLFSDDFSSKFPCLMDLSVHDCGGCKGIQISSPSLECISFTHNKKLRVKFDVPSIRKFIFLGTSIPSLSFKTSTSNWVSDISISCRRAPNATWFLKLNKLLTKLCPSKVSLSLGMNDVWEISDCAEDIKGLPKPQVENLTIDWPPICPALFNCLFRCCRPMYVFQSNASTRNCDFMKFVYKNVMEKVSLKCNSASQSMSGECDLEGVDVEFFDKAISAWRPRLLDASTSPGAEEQRIRLHLRWT